MARRARRLLLALAVPALVYLAICTWFYLQQRSVMYFPQATRVATAETDFELRHDGVQLRGWQLHPEQGAPILYFGGNAEQVGLNRDAFARLWPRRSVYLLAYRGYGASEGEPSQEALFADALALFDAVRQRHPGQPIAVVGRSLGSGVASYVAAQRPVAKLVLVTPFDSMAAVGSAHYGWLPVGWLLKDRYESTRYLTRYDGPLLILRAGRDEVVPPLNTDRLVASLARPPQVVDIPDADHNTIDADPRYDEALVRFLP